MTSFTGRFSLVRPVAAGLAFAALMAGMLHAQARSAPDWTTQGADAQRTSWVRADPYISLDTLTKFQLVWKLKVDNESRHGNALTAPVALGNLMTFRGFKSLIFVGGSSNNVYAIDYDFGTLFWRTHHNYTAGAREYAGSSTCPGGMTVPLTRAASLTPATQLAFFGFARPPRPAKGDVGEPGRGAPQLAEILARQAARGANRGGSDTAAAPGTREGRGAAAAPARGTPPPARGGGGGRGGRGPNFVFSVAADGLLRGLIPDTGDLALAPARLLPANATGNSLIWTDGHVYAATSNTCGSVPEAVWAMDFAADSKPVTSWETGGAPVLGVSVGTDGTVYATTGSGKSEYANSVVALERGTLKLKDWFTAPEAFLSTPVVIAEEGRTLVAATAAGGRLYLLDGASLGGAEHRTPLVAVPPSPGVQFGREAVATWRDTSGVRWIMAPTTSAVEAYRVTGDSRPAVERGWTSRAFTAARTPTVVNGVVFALDAGANRPGGPNAVLYALDPATGKDVWNSGSAITSAASAGLAAGTGQVYVVTHDNTVWAFGIPLAID